MTQTAEQSKIMSQEEADSNKTDTLTIAIVGSGGDGVALLGTLLLRMAARQGLYGMMVQSYGPQIRGGESAVMLRFGTSEVLYEGDTADLLLCFRLSDLLRFRGSVRLHDESIVILDASETGDLPGWLGCRGKEEFHFPFAHFDEQNLEILGEPKNMMGMALLCKSLAWPSDPAKQVLEDRFGRRPDVLARNIGAFEKAWNTPDVPLLPELKPDGANLTTLIDQTGNEAVAHGSIAAGMRFFAGYPITPSSEIMETLIKELPPVGGKILQAEDEIAAIGMVLGASFGGVPAMTATSGPGLSLMTEMIGLSSMAEVPAVIVDCQRAGPVTGMPSRTEQADLFHAVYAGHGDFPRAVLGVFDVVHAHHVMHKAFHLSESYQLPVLVLSDAYVAQRRQIHEPITEGAAPPQRLRWQEGGGPARFKVMGEETAAPFRVPGTPGGMYLATGIEHTEEGHPTSDTVIHHRMNAKRFRKLDSIRRETADWYRTLGDERASRGLVAWGSQYGLLREWVTEHTDFRVFMPEILHPYPLEAFEQWKNGLDWLGIVELSYQGQFRQYLLSLTDVHLAHSISRSGGVPMTRQELTRMVAEATA